MATSDGLISDISQDCLIAFEDSLSEPTHHPKDLISRDSVEDQLVRFKLWAANIGAFAGSHTSLDYRLRDSSDIRDIILQLLQVLRRSIKSCMSYRQGLFTS